jgi:hypothetical protein
LKTNISRQPCRTGTTVWKILAGQLFGSRSMSSSVSMNELVGGAGCDGFALVREKGQNRRSESMVMGCDGV